MGRTKAQGLGGCGASVGPHPEDVLLLQHSAHLQRRAGLCVLDGLDQFLVEPNEDVLVVAEPLE